MKNQVNLLIFHNFCGPCVQLDAISYKSHQKVKKETRCHKCCYLKAMKLNIVHKFTRIVIGCHLNKFIMFYSVQNLQLDACDKNAQFFLKKIDFERWNTENFLNKQQTLLNNKL